MRKTRNALLGILTIMSGAILAVPTEAAERYIPGVHLYKERFFSFPYGGSYLKRAKRPHDAQRRASTSRVTPLVPRAPS